MNESCHSTCVVRHVSVIYQWVMSHMNEWQTRWEWGVSLSVFMWLCRCVSVSVAVSLCRVWPYLCGVSGRNTLPHTATHCNILQHTATHCNRHIVSLSRKSGMCVCVSVSLCHVWPYLCGVSSALQCSILWRTVTHCNSLQHTNTLQHTAEYYWLSSVKSTWNCLQRAATLCNTPHHSATHCNILLYIESLTHLELTIVCVEGDVCFTDSVWSQVCVSPNI